MTKSEIITRISVWLKREGKLLPSEVLNDSAKLENLLEVLTPVYETTASFEPSKVIENGSQWTLSQLLPLRAKDLITQSYPSLLERANNILLLDWMLYYVHLYFKNEQQKTSGQTPA